MIMELEINKKQYAYTENGLPFGGKGIREVIMHTPNHSIYVKIDPSESPYKDQDYWQIMEGNYTFCEKPKPTKQL